MGDDLRFALISLHDKVAAGFLVLCVRSANPTAHLLAIKYSALNNIHSLVTFLSWKTVNWAFEHGFRYADFGTYPVDRISDPAHPFYKLKERFGVAFVPEYYLTLPTLASRIQLREESIEQYGG